MKQEKNEHAPRIRTMLMILSAIVAFGAMGLTWYQSLITSRGVQAQTWQTLSAPGTEISKVFIEHPELRPYFYENKPFSREDPNYHAVSSVAEMYLDFLEAFIDDYVANLPGMEPNGVNRVLWDKYFTDMFASSPALQSIAKAEQKWYSTNFAKYMPTKDPAAKRTSNKPSEVTSQ